MAEAHLTPIEVGLTAAIVAVEDGGAAHPGRRRSQSGTRAGLPFGPFDPLAHRTFEIGLRNWVAAQTGDQRRLCRAALHVRRPRPPRRPDDTGMHMISVGYLALTRDADKPRRSASAAGFEPWYAYFPWEDWRDGRPEILDRDHRAAAGAMGRTAAASDEPAAAARPARAAAALLRRRRRAWDEEKVLERYELLYEAGLVEEARRDGREPPRRAAKIPRSAADAVRPSPHPGDRDRAAARQAEIPPGGVRADAGRIHPDRTAAHGRGDLRHGICTSRTSADWSRRAALVEPTGETSTATGGRPAALYRFRREVVQERPAPGSAVRRPDS